MPQQERDINSIQENPQWAELLQRLAVILNKANLDTAIKWGVDVFTYNGRNVVSYGGFKNFCSLWFYNGVFLEDKYKVLIAASGGKTRSLRQWRFTSITEVDEKKILEYVREAIEIEKKGLKLSTEKFRASPLPKLLATAFKKDKKLKAAFDRLTPGKQKEYITYIKDARQEVTQLKRLEKITPIILNGQGLNDKYR